MTAPTTRLGGPRGSFSDLTPGDLVHVSSDSPPQIASLTPECERPPRGPGLHRVLAVLDCGRRVDLELIAP